MPKRVLIVEDEQDIAMVLCHRLQDAGYEVAAAPDAIMAISECHKFKPNLVILDLMLPAGGGLSVLRNLRQSVRTNLIPILILTGSKDAALKKAVLDAGADAFFEKPYDHLELIATIKRLTEPR
jgi:DNA-binding response OmpR family regulator